MIPSILPILSSGPISNPQKGPPAILALHANPSTSFSGLTGAAALRDDEWRLPWLVVYTRPRQEKALAGELRHLGITYFLPLVLRETVSGGRRRRNLYPLFASYLFFAGDEAAREACLRTGRVVQLVTPTHQQRPRLAHELKQLELALRCRPESVVVHRKLEPGTPVRITSGAMRGVEGVVINSDNKRRLLLAVSTLGVSVTVELHADLAEPTV